MSTDVTIQSFAEAINTSWRKTTDTILETARLCAEASEKLSKQQIENLKEQLDCSGSVFSKLEKIGKNALIQSDPVRSLLPAGYTVVYEIAKLPKADLDVAVETGIINHKLTREQILLWKAERNGKNLAKPAEDPVRVIGTLQVPSDYDGTKQAQLEKELEKLRNKFGFSIDRPLDPAEIAFSRMEREIDAKIRRDAKRFIKELKSKRLGLGWKKLTAAEKKKRWPFSDDETAIPADATWDQVQAVLDFVGIGDQFERLRDQALRMSGMPEDVVSSKPVLDHDEAMKELRMATELVNERRAKYNPEKYADFK